MLTASFQAADETAELVPSLEGPHRFVLDGERPIRHVRPRKQDCAAVLGWAATQEGAAAAFGRKRCRACGGRVFALSFPLTATPGSPDYPLIKDRKQLAEVWSADAIGAGVGDAQ